MTTIDNKLTDNEIVKALECFRHRILNSRLAEKITEREMMSIINALDLINRLQAENDRKDKNYIDLLKTSSERAVIISELQAENERLKGIKTTDWLVKGISKEQLEKEKIEAIHENAYKLGKAKAYKEFAERLKHIIMWSPKNHISITAKDIDNLLKELVGDKNDNGTKNQRVAKG